MTHGHGTVTKTSVVKSSNFFKKSRNADIFQLLNMSGQFKNVNPMQTKHNPCGASQFVTFGLKDRPS